MDRGRKSGKRRNLHVDQACPVAQEALALLVDPVHHKDKEDAINISNAACDSILFIPLFAFNLWNYCKRNNNAKEFRLYWLGSEEQTLKSPAALWYWVRWKLWVTLLGYIGWIYPIYVKNVKQKRCKWCVGGVWYVGSWGRAACVLAWPKVMFSSYQSRKNWWLVRL